MTKPLKKVIIITYYWPPSGGSGVQRYLYFSKYLRQFGWEPVIFTVEDGAYSVIDKKLMNEVPEGVEVIREKAWEPNQFYKKITGRKQTASIDSSIFKDKKKSLINSLAIWIRGNLFIPDARLFWIKPSVKRLNKYIQANNVDAIISTSPPQSTHLIANKVAKKNNIPWLADFRDPWTDIGYFKELKLTRWAKKKHLKLEKTVMQNADSLLTVSRIWQKDFEKIRQSSVDYIPNGYEPSENSENIIPDKAYYTWSYVGVLTDDREPTVLWEEIDVLYKANVEFATKFRLRFVGNISEQIQENIKKYSFCEKVTFKGNVPKSELDEVLYTSDVLLLIGIPGVRGVLPGKVFEYLNTKKHILNVSEKNSEAEDFLNKVKGGLSSSFEDRKSIKKNVTMLWEKYETNELVNSIGLDKFSRENITRELALVLNRITK
jgi:glycosyltransferase involved in cell wall biosynthesis